MLQKVVMKLMCVEQNCDKFVIIVIEFVSKTIMVDLKIITTKYLKAAKIFSKQSPTIRSTPSPLAARSIHICFTPPTPLVYFYCHTPRAQGLMQLIASLMISTRFCNGERGNLDSRTGCRDGGETSKYHPYMM